MHKKWSNRLIVIWVILVIPFLTILAVLMYPATMEVAMELMICPPMDDVNKFDETDPLSTEDRNIFAELITSFVPPETTLILNQNFGQDSVREKRDVEMSWDIYHIIESLIMELIPRLSYENRAQLTWLPVRQRRNIHILDLLYRVLSQSTPSDLRELFEPLSFHGLILQSSFDSLLKEILAAQWCAASIFLVCRQIFELFIRISEDSMSSNEKDKRYIRRKQALKMISYMDQTVPPCQNFYQYACGNWQANNPIPPDKAGIDVFENLREQLDLTLKMLLESPDEPSNYSTTTESMDSDEDISVSKTSKRQISTYNGSELPFDDFTVKESTTRAKPKDAIEKVKDLYKSCMNHDLLTKRSHQPLLELLNTLGGWPMIEDNWNVTEFNWVEVMAELKLYNNDILLAQWIGPDIKNSEMSIVQFDQTSLGLPTREYFINASNKVYLDSYRNYISTIAYLIGGNNETIQVDVGDMIAFEISLAKITTKAEVRQNISEIYNKLSLKELKQVVPGINFKRYLEIVLHRDVDENEHVVFYALKYAQDLSKLVQKTNPRVVSNYLLWRFVRHRANNLDDRFHDAKQNFFLSLFGRERSPPRWKNCVTQVNSNMGMAVGTLFVRKFFDENSKNDTLEMTRLIQDSFKRIIKNSGWIDDATRILAYEKVDAMLLRIGYPNFILFEDQLNKYYAEIDIYEDKYFENTLNILQHLVRIEQEHRERSPPRWKNCVTQVNSNMGMAVGTLFVRKFFDENSKNDTLEMTRLIQDSFKRIIKNSGWIDDATRILAYEKVDAMLLRIGYPNFILFEDQLNKYYAEIDIYEDKYFENTLNILQHLVRIEQEQVGQPVNKSVWSTPPAIVNAYYSRNKNQILFPAGILLPPFYHRHFPRAVNFGGIGVVIGHEITHGFDDKGRFFDQHGNLGNWWHDHVSDEFYNRAECLVAQYSQYIVDDIDLAVDGQTTQGENIADNGGIKQAYHAYNTWLSKHGAADETFDEIMATPQQLFFLNFAQIWCGAMRPQASRNKLISSVHSPGPYRVIGTLSNMKEFAEAYGCPLGSMMNPPEKCIVW